MSEIFHIKQNNTSPSILADLESPEGTSPNIAGASVQFQMRNRRTNALVVDAAASIINSQSPARVRYEWQAADTANAGQYMVEWEVTYIDGKIESFPNDRFGTVVLITGEI